MLATVAIGSEASSARQIEFLVDMGAFYSALPPELMRELGIEARWRESVTVADGRQVDAPIGVAHMAINGRQGVVFVSEMDVPIPLLGVTALETLGLKVDPVEQKLEETRPFGPAALEVR